MSSHVMIDGTVTTDVEAYLASWKSIGDVVARIMGGQLHSFDPSFGILIDNGVVTVSKKTALGMKALDDMNTRSLKDAKMWADYAKKFQEERDEERALCAHREQQLEELREDRNVHKARLETAETTLDILRPTLASVQQALEAVRPIVQEAVADKGNGAGPQDLLQLDTAINLARGVLKWWNNGRR